jgi:hypothetical protein
VATDPSVTQDHPASARREDSECVTAPSSLTLTDVASDGTVNRALAVYGPLPASLPKTDTGGTDDWSWSHVRVNGATGNLFVHNGFALTLMWTDGRGSWVLRATGLHADDLLGYAAALRTSSDGTVSLPPAMTAGYRQARSVPGRTDAQAYWWEVQYSKPTADGVLPETGNDGDDVFRGGNVTVEGHQEPLDIDSELAGILPAGVRRVTVNGIPGVALSNGVALGDGSLTSISWPLGRGLTARVGTVGLTLDESLAIASGVVEAPADSPVVLGSR